MRVRAGRGYRGHSVKSAGEGALVKAILDKYANHPRMRCWRVNTGAARIGNRFIRFGIKGQADIQGVLAPSGRAVFIECKTQTGRLRPEQIAFGRMVEEMGALFIVARSLEDVDAVLLVEPNVLGDAGLAPALPADTRGSKNAAKDKTARP